MNATTVAIDLAKSVFQVAVADHHWRVTATHRFTRLQLERWLSNCDATLVVMEACGSVRISAIVDADFSVIADGVSA